METSISNSGPRLTHDSLGPSKPITQTASRSVQPFLHPWPQCPYPLQWGAPFPLKITHSHGWSGPHLICGSLFVSRTTNDVRMLNLSVFAYSTSPNHKCLFCVKDGKWKVDTTDNSSSLSVEDWRLTDTKMRSLQLVSNSRGNHTQPRDLRLHCKRVAEHNYLRTSCSDRN